MKAFKTTIIGYEVTNDNFIEVAKVIAAKHGVCPALNSLIMAVVSNDETIEHSKKGLFKGIDKYIKLIGYSPKYFNSQMSKIGPNPF